jgi:3-oxoacyl-[acyl-carrier protein] reductase
MREVGGGAIIMIASIYGREAGGRMTYNAVKAAEISLAKALAQQLAPAEFVKRELPFGRFGRPEEIGAVVAFLASGRASWVSGASIVVDGAQSRSNI